MYSEVQFSMLVEWIFCSLSSCKVDAIEQRVSQMVIKVNLQITFQSYNFCEVSNFKFKKLSHEYN